MILLTCLLLYDGYRKSALVSNFPFFACPLACVNFVWKIKLGNFFLKFSLYNLFHLTQKNGLRLLLFEELLCTSGLKSHLWMLIKWKAIVIVLSLISSLAWVHSTSCCKIPYADDRWVTLRCYSIVARNELT
jgi:hypothetical protein